MIRVAVNSLPLKSGHKNRGIGYYTSSLLNALKEDEEIVVEEFLDLAEVKDAQVIHYPWFDFFFHTLPIRHKFPIVVTIHDVMPLIFSNHYPVGLKGKINFLWQKMALNTCKYIITDSTASKKDIIKLLKIEDKKIEVIPLAADQRFKVIDNNAKLLYVKRKYNLPDKFLLYVGDANWSKNLPFLVEGFRQLITIPSFEGLKLILVGGVFLKDVENINHPELKSLKLVNKLIKQYGLEDNIIRPGRIEDDDLVSIYNLATVYIQPSLYEGFGLPVLEALACGASVISSNRGSLKEVGGKAAIYFDPADIKQFILTIQEILQDASLRRKLSKLGLEQAAKFSWRRCANETKTVYIEALKNA